MTPESYDLNSLKDSHGKSIGVDSSVYKDYEVPYTPQEFGHVSYMERLKQQAEYYADELGIVFENSSEVSTGSTEGARIGVGKLPPVDSTFVDTLEDPDKPENRPDWDCFKEVDEETQDSDIYKSLLDPVVGTDQIIIDPMNTQAENDIINDPEFRNKMIQICSNPFALDRHVDEIMQRIDPKINLDSMSEDDVHRYNQEKEIGDMPPRVYGEGYPREYYEHPQTLRSKPYNRRDFRKQLFDGIPSEEYSKVIFDKDNPPDEIIFRTCKEEHLNEFPEFQDFYYDRVQKLENLKVEYHEKEPYVELYRNGKKMLEYDLADKSFQQMEYLLRDVGFKFKYKKGMEPEKIIQHFD
jgi:hypothetical protein